MLHNRVSFRMKRVFDIVLSIAALAILLVPLCAIALAVFCAMGAPVFFRQKRSGKDGRIFTLYKFRTMRAAVGPDGAPLPDPARLTPFGRFLRNTSLDELPEFWNVLRGDMSLVGPRPLLPEYLPLYNARQARRHEVRPGITGLAQVSGRNALSWEEKFELDVRYVETRTMRMDIAILFMTIPVALSRRGISHGAEGAMPPFRGSGATDSRA